MIELKSQGSFTISSRPGRVFTFPAGSLPAELSHPRELVDTSVLIDDRPYKVTGVEHFAIECPRPESGIPRCEHPFGLLTIPWPVLPLASP